MAVSVTFGEDPGEDDRLLTVDDLISGAVKSDYDTATSAKMNARDALDKLRAGRQNIMKQTEQDRWLAFAAGMLKPTKTGGFGESLGMGLEGLGEARAAGREELADIDEQVLQGEIDLVEAEQRATTAARPRLGTSRTIYHPDDVAANLPVKERRIVNMQPIYNADGTTNYAISGQGEDGEEYFEVATTLDPRTVAATTGAEQQAKYGSDLIAADVTAGINAMAFYNKATRARDILNQVKTFGLKRTAVNFARLFGIETPEVTDITELESLFGEQVLENLQKLTGPKSDFEFREVSKMSANIGGDTEANKRILDAMIASYERIIDEGEIATEMLEDPGLRQYAGRKFTQWRERTKDAAAKKQPAPKREPTEDSAAALYQMIQGAEGDPAAHKKILQQYNRHFDLTEEMRVELRKLGVAI